MGPESIAAHGLEPRVAWLASYPPRECGIATFTRDLTQAVAQQTARAPRVVAIEEPGSGERSYPPEVFARLTRDDPRSYDRLNAELHAADIDVLCVQHEYGLYGGQWGALLPRALRRIDVPVVTTMHTVLSRPSPELLGVTRALCEHSSALVVLAKAAIPLLTDVYGCDPTRLHFIPHGIPSVSRVPGLRRAAKARLGFSGRTLLSTFGLIGPGKGIEYVLRALPEAARRHPDLLYLVLGETHPGERRVHGERYRRSLEALVAELDIGRHVSFEPRFLEYGELIEYLLATDLYLMPYLEPEQIASGTLAYAVGCGKAVIATSFRYAREVLANGQGALVPFREAPAIEAELLRLLGDRGALAAMERRAYEASRIMQWPHVASEYRRLFAELGTRRTIRLSEVASGAEASLTRT
jgi:glycosyltransferase involved in cell wall biosynthesis